MKENWTIAEAIRTLGQIDDWDYRDATEEQIRALIDQCIETADRAKAKLAGRTNRTGHQEAKP